MQDSGDIEASWFLTGVSILLGMETTCFCLPSRFT